MNSNGRGRTVGGILLAVAFVFGIGIVSSGTAQAQDRWERNRQNGNWDRNRDNRNRDNRNRDRNYRRDRRWDNRQNGNWDRNSGRGYVYRDGNVYRGGTYGTYGNYGRGSYGNGGYNQAAVNQGYQDGLYTGSNDARRRQRYNPQRSHFYKDANTQGYRQGFLRGYQQGYQQYGGYNGSYGNQRFPW